MSIPMREDFILCPDSLGWHRLFYSDWGPKDGPVVLCVHYLTGNGRYFDMLAAALAEQGYRVICPDMPGRGRSDFLKNPEDYTLPHYLMDIGSLLAAFQIKTPQSIDWIGASMGGFMGMIAAAMVDTPVRRLALIDVGPAVAASELQDICAYVMAPPQTDTIAELESAIIKSRQHDWGPVPDGYWKDFTTHNTRPLPDGKFTLAYDPAIAVPMSRTASSGVDLWTVWDYIPCPVLTLRGEHSNLLTPDTAEAMKKRGPGARNALQLETIKNCGHVPSLTTQDQITLIRNWLGPL